MSSDDRERAEFFEALRRSSARLLRLDPDHLSASQQVRVDRCAALRLLLDRFQSQQLAGGEIDAKAFIAASAELERPLGGEPSAPTSVLASSEGRDKLRRLVETTLLAADVADPDAAKLQEREEMAAVAAASPSAPPPPPPPPEPPRSDNVIPLDAAARANANLPPAHYLKETQPREPWRDFYDGRVTGPSSWPLPQ